MTGLYLYSLKHAEENNEKELLKSSFNSSIRCREKMAASIDAHYHEYRLGSEAIIQEISGEFGVERMMLHLALSLQKRKWDLRLSLENIAWAEDFLNKCIPAEFCEPYQLLTLDGTQSFMLDILTNKVREMYVK